MTAERPICLSLIVLAVLCGIPQAQAAAYTLTVTADHGSVTISPDKPQYDAGEIVRLIPRPETGYCFTGWSGSINSRHLVLQIAMNGDTAVTANFGRW
ncbi:MAG: hypothetical protein EHM35_02225, partial [Planctomycetaceae bacterium]